MKALDIRVWNEGKKEFYSEPLLMDGKDLAVDVGGSNWEFEWLTNPIVNHFIGLKDTKGNKIYEGDKVRLRWGKWLDREVTIVSNDYSFGYGSDHVFNSFKCLTDDGVNLNHCMTIIGNIYQ